MNLLAANEQVLSSLRNHTHPGCVVCSPDHPWGFHLQCVTTGDGAVEGEFTGGEGWAGYQGRVHGGMIAALLDSAMTQCLFAHGCPAYTAQLNVRYRHPVTTVARMTVRAWLAESRPPLHLVRAELVQDDQVRANALGKFMASPG